MRPRIAAKRLPSAPAEVLAASATVRPGTAREFGHTSG